jgi:hypothetical protein
MSDFSDGKRIPETALRKTCEKTSQELRKDAAEWFATGVNSWGKHQAYAERLELTDSQLSDALACKPGRTIQLWHTLPLLEEQQGKAALAFLGWGAGQAGLGIYVPVDTVEMSRAEAELVWTLMTDPVLWPYAEKKFCAHYCCMPDLLRAAVEMMLKVGR